MLWEIYFWLFAALLLLPLPFKIAGYVTGKDRSPVAVKVEEIGNALFFAIGLIALYGYLKNISFASPVLWRAWLVIAIALSLAAPWSPKMKYAESQIGRTPTIAIAAISTAFSVPLLVGVYLYATKA